MHEVHKEIYNEKSLATFVQKHGALCGKKNK
jgi:hypothetical protein